MKKYIFLTIAALTTLGIGVFGTTSASAQGILNHSGFDTLAQKIASKFNLNQSEVQAVFNQARTEKQAFRKAEYESQLSQYVKEGKLTEAQKQLIEKKISELESQRESHWANMQNLSTEERRAQMEEHRAALETWAKQNGIDIQYLRPMGGRGFGRGK